MKGIQKTFEQLILGEVLKYCKREWTSIKINIDMKKSKEYSNN